MEITVFPQGFNIQPTVVQLPTGPVDAIQLVLLDASGIAVKAAFPAEAWVQFQRFVADPEGEAARAEARAKIIAPNGLAPSIKTAKR